MSPRPKLAEQHPNLETAIKETAWQQIAEKGAAALSLRAIARALNITAPAIYNYFPRRDNLVTAMIVDAFTSLGESQKASILDIPQDHLNTRLSTLGLAYRDWAVAHPQRYQLIFGTPIPGYKAPSDITTGPAASLSFVPLLETLQATYIAGRLRVERSAPLTPELKSMLEAWSQSIEEIDIEVLYMALIIGTQVHGLVSMEISQHFPAYITDPGEVFRREIATLLIHILEE